MASLYDSMLARQKALASGQGDIGNADLYGYNQVSGGAASAPPPVSPLQPPPSAPTPVTTAQDVTNTTANVGRSAVMGQPTTVAQSFQQALVNRLNPQGVSTADPTIAPAITANRLAEQRGLESNRNLLAERAAATGTNLSGGFEAQNLGLAQDRAAREGQFEASAVQHANDLQNQNLTSSLGMVGNLLTGNANRTQQQELANLDAALRREGYGLQGELGRGDLALRSRLGEGNLNLGLLSALLGHDINQGQLALGGAQLDQNGLLSLLAGL